MTESFNVFDPPASDKRYGFVVGRIIRRIGDTTLDTDSYPDAANINGRVRFTPVESVTKSSDYRAIVFREPVDADLDSYGYVTSSSGNVRGLWLTVGYWMVSFNLHGHDLRPFYIEVLETHTEQTPLDLADQQPDIAPDLQAYNSIRLPAGGTDGDILVKNADGTTRWEHYLLDGVTLEDLRGPQGETGPPGPPGAPGPAGQLNLSENMLLNGGFELGNLNYWWKGGTLQTTDVPGKDGANKAVTWPAGETTHTDQTFPSIPVGPAGIYQIDVWLKADTPGSRFYLDIREETGQLLSTSKTVGGQETPYVLNAETLPTSWTKYTRYARFGDKSLVQANKTAKVLRMGALYLNHVNGANKNASVSMGGIWIRPVQQITPSPASIGEVELKDNSVTQAKMADASVGTSELVDGAVTLDKLADDSVTSDKIADRSVKPSNIEAKSLDASVIKNGSINKDLLDPKLQLGGGLESVYSVKDFGAKGDGIADDGPAIQACLNAAGVKGAVFFPAGTYLSNQTINALRGQTLFGFITSGQPIPLKGAVIKSGVNGVLLNLNEASLKSVHLLGPGGANSTDGVGYQAINSTGACVISDCTIYGFDYGLKMQSNWYAVIERVFFFRNKVAIETMYCYNVYLGVIRIAGKMLDGTYGNGLYMGDRSMVNNVGGSYEQVLYAVRIAGGSQSFTSRGMYFESALAGSNCIHMYSGASHVSISDSQIYLDNIGNFFYAGSSSTAGSTLFASGNKFKAAANATAGETAYTLNTNMDQAVILGDDWTDVRGKTGYTYYRKKPTNSLILSPSGVTNV